LEICATTVRSCCRESGQNWDEVFSRFTYIQIIFSVATQVSILVLRKFLHSKRELQHIACDEESSYLFKYVSTIFMRSLGSTYNPNPGNTVAKSKRAKREAALTIRRRKTRAFQICIHFYCTITGDSYTRNPVYAPENSKSTERGVVLAVQLRKIRAFQIWIHFYCAIIGLPFAELKIIKAFQ